MVAVTLWGVEKHVVVVEVMIDDQSYTQKFKAEKNIQAWTRIEPMTGGVLMGSNPVLALFSQLLKFCA